MKIYTNDRINELLKNAETFPRFCFFSVFIRSLDQYYGTKFNGNFIELKTHLGAVWCVCSELSVYHSFALLVFVDNKFYQVCDAILLFFV